MAGGLSIEVDKTPWAIVEMGVEVRPKGEDE